MGGRTLPIAFKHEGESLSTIKARVKDGATIYADEASVWDHLHAHYGMGRVNHMTEFMDEGVCTNQVESFFSRIRRAEIGQHHHIAGPYLDAYACEMAWREDNRRKSNGTLFALAADGAGNRSIGGRQAVPEGATYRHPRAGETPAVPVWYAR